MRVLDAFNNAQARAGCPARGTALRLCRFDNARPQTWAFFSPLLNVDYGLNVDYCRDQISTHCHVGRMLDNLSGPSKEEAES